MSGPADIELPWRDPVRPAVERWRAPYQYADVEYVMLAARFDEATLRALLPAHLEPAESMTGGFCFCIGGMPDNPLDKAGAWIDVNGHDGPDGARGRYGVRLLATGSVAQAFADNGNAVVGGGTARQAQGDTIQVAGRLADGRDLFRAVVRPRPGPGRRAAYYHYYLGQRAAGETAVLPLAVGNEFVAAEPLHFENLASPGDPLSRLVPRQLLWAARPRGAVFTYGSPLGPDVVRNAQTRLVDLLDRLGRGAIWLDERGGAIACNAAAHALLGDGLSLVGARLRAEARETQRSLEALLGDALRPGSTELRLIAVPRPSGRKPILVQAVPIGAGQIASLDIVDARRHQALLLLTDPEKPVRGDVARELQLFGLTPAEARLAALVGSGQSAADAARRLRLSQGSARVSLARAYAKLDISRQSELALLVARVEAAV